MKNFIFTIPAIISRLYRGKNIIWQIVLIGLTFLIVISGFDWFYFLAVRNESLNTVFFPALPIGFLLPIFLPIALLFFGALRKDTALSLYGWALGQAALLGWLLSSTYKAFTGRVQPDLSNLMVDSSRNFQFGFFEHGIFWGWPSSHTTVAFAVVFACITLLSRKKNWIRYGALAYALYIGIGVSLAIHWFSEFIAGAILGAIIGREVGKEWKQRLQ